MPPDSVSRPAHAKLNLALSIGPPAGERGYHPVCSWFVALDLHDDLTLTRLPPTSGSSYDIDWAEDAPVHGEIDWPTDRDLAVRAHKLLEARAARPLPVALTLRKRVPVGGGLGGGSSDAAAALTATNELFDLGLTRVQLAALGSGLGSDIPFFIDNDSTTAPRPALVSGFGEAVERLPRVEGAAATLIFPPFGSATAAVYAAFDNGPDAPALRPALIRALIDAASTDRIDPDRLFNDLAVPAGAVEPKLATLLAAANLAAASAGRRAHLTGSGSTIFILCQEDDPASALAAAEDLAALVRACAPEVACLTARLV